MTTTKSNKRIAYSLEIYKPAEMQDLPAADECRHYHADTPFPAIHVGDLCNAWVWKFPGDDLAQFQKAMGPYSIEPMQPVAIVDRVMHDIIDTEDVINYRVFVFTKLHPKARRE